jgi:hypothetical protein
LESGTERRLSTDSSQLSELGFFARRTNGSSPGSPPAGCCFACDCERLRAHEEHDPVAAAPARRKTFLHPLLGPLTLDCDALAVQGSDLRLVVYTAGPRTPDADALAQLAAGGPHCAFGA